MASRLYILFMVNHASLFPAEIEILYVASLRQTNYSAIISGVSGETSLVDSTTYGLKILGKINTIIFSDQVMTTKGVLSCCELKGRAAASPLWSNGS